MDGIQRSKKHDKLAFSRNIVCWAHRYLAAFLSLISQLVLRSYTPSIDLQALE